MRSAHRRSLPFIPLTVAGLCLVAAPVPSGGQEPPDTMPSELERLRERIDSLEAVLRRLQEEGRQEEAEGALEELRAAARAAAGDAPPTDTAQAFEGRQRSLQALNPEISVNADAFGHVHTDDPGQQNFILREVELSLQSALDPYSRAKVFAGFHAAGPELIPFGDEHDHAGEGEEGDAHGGEFALEEAYVEWIGLPAGVGLKLGRFYQRFGALNRWHAHALPFQSRSLPHLAFIGEEPLGQTGVSASVLLPVRGDAGTYEATLEVTRSSNESLFGASDRASVLGHLNGFWQLSRSTDLDLGLSWIHGRYEDVEHVVDRNLLGAETSLTWRPPGQALYRSLVVRGGVMLLDGLVEEHHEDEEDPPGEEEEEHGADRALGLWSLAELRLSERWMVGARFDWSENPLDPDQTAWLAGPTLTWWQSEWVRLRLEYDLMGRSFAEDEGRLWLQVTFAMGPHKHETY